MPVASCVATGTACGRHSVASLLSMPVASCVATGTACGCHPVASLLSMREGFPLKLPFTSLLFLPVSQNGAQAFFLLRPSSHRGAISESPSAAALFRYGRLSCLRHALRAWIRRLPVVRPATAIASSTGPGYHAFPTPGPPAATHDDSPAARRRDRHTQPDKRIGRGELTGWWPQDRGRQERRCSGKRNEMLQKGPSPHLPPARKRHEFF